MKDKLIVTGGNFYKSKTITKFSKLSLLENSDVNLPLLANLVIFIFEQGGVQ